MKKALVVVDYQKDFVDGALGFPCAEKLMPGISAMAEAFLSHGDPVVFTLDTHGPDYLSTREGRHLPVEHCLEGTPGWRLYGDLERYMDAGNGVCLVKKGAFGADGFDFLKPFEPEQIELCGLVTNLCVISNAVVLQTAFPNAEIVIHSGLCGGPDPELHRKALDVMAGLQMRISD